MNFLSLCVFISIQNIGLSIPLSKKELRKIIIYDIYNQGIIWYLICFFVFPQVHHVCQHFGKHMWLHMTILLVIVKTCNNNVETKCPPPLLKCLQHKLSFHFWQEEYQGSTIIKRLSRLTIVTYLCQNFGMHDKRGQIPKSKYQA